MTTTPTHPREATVVEAAPKQLLIAGKWRDATGERTFAVEDPATGATLCHVADASPDDALAALTVVSGSVDSQGLVKGFTSRPASPPRATARREPGHVTAPKPPCRPVRRRAPRIPASPSASPAPPGLSWTRCPCGSRAA